MGRSAKFTDIQLLRVKVEGYLNLVRIHREIESRAQELLAGAGIEGMSMAQATALLVLVQEGAPITAARLAGLLNVSAVTVGRFVRSLEHNRWIRRRRDPDDARAMLLEPTSKTHARLGKFFTITDQLMHEAYEGMTDQDVRAVVKLLAAIRRNLYQASGKPDTVPQALV
jgi:DNA-binding MarR family transcriptional regulator